MAKNIWKHDLPIVAFIVHYIIVTAKFEALFGEVESFNIGRPVSTVVIRSI